MDAKVFEGTDRINSLSKKRKREFEDLKDLEDKLNFPSELDLVVFCTSIGLYKVEIGNNEFKKLPSSRELVSTLRFEDKDLFDRLIITLGREKNRLEKFEGYFYTGFKVLRKWLKEREPDLDNELERFSDIIDYLDEEILSQ